MATEQKAKDETFEVDYSDRSDTPTTFAGLTKADKESLAEQYGGKVDELDYTVVSDDIGRAVKVQVAPKEKPAK